MAGGIYNGLIIGLIHLFRYLLRYLLRYLRGARTISNSILLIFLVWMLVTTDESKASSVSRSIVIDQIYGAGGNSGAAWRNDFVELYNIGRSPVDLTGWAIHYASSNGTTWQRTLLGGTLAPGGRYLVQEASGGASGSMLPAADATGTIAMASGAGKVVLTSDSGVIGGGTVCPSGANVVDLAGYGTGTTCFEGAGPAPAPGSSTAVLRIDGGCTDTDRNELDLVVGAPDPRNTMVPPQVCGTPTNPGGKGSASHDPVQAGGVLFLRVAVTPGTSPTSTGVTVSGDLRPIGGPAEQPFLDDGKNGDESGSDGVYNARVLIPPTMGAAAITLGVTIRDGEGRRGEAMITFRVVRPPASAALVISQVFAGGGNSGAPWSHDWIELFNRGLEMVDLTGWSIQYATAGGSAWSKVDLAGQVAPGRYHLVRLSSGGANGIPPPTPDSTGSLNLATTAGKIALVKGTLALATTCPVGESRVDMIGYGETVTCFEGAAPAPAPGSVNSLRRLGSGCLDEDSSQSDWMLDLPLPRNSASPPHLECAAYLGDRHVVVGDQHAGSLLLFPIYSSISANPEVENTRLALTNSSATDSVTIHLFWIDGDSASIADDFICLTSNQTVVLTASEFDPDVSGYLIAVAVDPRTGCPINFNRLLGEVHLKLASGHSANLTAVAIAALEAEPVRCEPLAPTAEIRFDGNFYQQLPTLLAIDHLPSTGDGYESMLILARIEGNLGTGMRTLGQVNGLLYDDLESPTRFALSSSRRQLRLGLNDAALRVVPRISTTIPHGRSGWLRLSHDDAGAMIGAVLTVHSDPASHAYSFGHSFGHGRSLHILGLTGTARLIIPLLPGEC